MTPRTAKKPNVKVLERQKDAFGLAEAAGFVADDGPKSDGGESTREEAVLALGRLGGDAGQAAVEWALQDPSPRVQAAAVRVLHLRGRAAELAAALEWLDPTRGEAHRLAVDAVLELQTISDGAHAGVAYAVARGLVRAAGAEPVGDEVPELLQMLIRAERDPEAMTEVLQELLAALADERVAVADRAQDLLPHFAPESIDGLVAELRSGTVPARAAAALGRIRDPRAIEPLVEGVWHEDPRVRRHCAEALGEIRHPAAAEALLQATHDPDYDVRVSAGAALDAMGSAGIVAGVSALLRPVLGGEEPAVGVDLNGVRGAS